jgi:hypothetical protein
MLSVGRPAHFDTARDEQGKLLSKERLFCCHECTLTYLTKYIYIKEHQEHNITWLEQKRKENSNKDWVPDPAASATYTRYERKRKASKFIFNDNSLLEEKYY